MWCMTKSGRYRWMWTLVGCLALLMLVGGCSKPSPIPISVRRLYLIILEQKDEQGRYRVLIQEKGAVEPKPFPPIKSIDGFDDRYKEGHCYQIIVKEVTSRSETRYLWTGKIWPEEAK